MGHEEVTPHARGGEPGQQQRVPNPYITAPLPAPLDDELRRLAEVYRDYPGIRGDLVALTAARERRAEMDRRRLMQCLGALAAGASVAPAAQIGRTGPAALSVVRGAGNWLSVIGRHGEVLIRISPRFVLDHPRETLEILTTGTFR